MADAISRLAAGIEALSVQGDLFRPCQRIGPSAGHGRLGHGRLGHGRLGHGLLGHGRLIRND